jgi:benzoyl-CoA 2,3-dioxygenase component B
MLTEEAHHMFVGETGVGRVVERTVNLMKEDPNEDARAQGGIDLPTIQKYLNLWYTVSLDLFGGEVSSNAAEAFAAGVKGRHKEATRFEDHAALGAVYAMEDVERGRVVQREVPMRNALNEVLRDDYVEDCQRGVDRWNKIIREAGIQFELALPSRRFHRAIGRFAEVKSDPSGNLLEESEWEARRGEWLPDEADEVYIKSLMHAVHQPGKIAQWIAPPRKGINGQPFEFQYVKRPD